MYDTHAQNHISGLSDIYIYIYGWATVENQAHRLGWTAVFFLSPLLSAGLLPRGRCAVAHAQLSELALGVASAVLSDECRGQPRAESCSRDSSTCKRGNFSSSVLGSQRRAGHCTKRRTSQIRLKIYKWMDPGQYCVIIRENIAIKCSIGDNSVHIFRLYFRIWQNCALAVLTHVHIPTTTTAAVHTE